jgi:anti-sigma regulatory factor (Ser/Thr protein kinase)
LTVDVTDYYYSIDSVVGLFVDSTNEISIDEIKNQPFETRPLEPNQSLRNTYWLRFKVTDTLPYPVNYRIWFSYANHISVYQPLKKGGYKQENIGVFDKKIHSNYYHTGIISLVNTSEIDTTKYIYAQLRSFGRTGVHLLSSNIDVQAISLTQEPLGKLNRDAFWDIYYNVFLGFLIGLSIYFTLTYFFNKEKSFLIYGLYLLTLFIYFINRIPLIFYLWNGIMPMLKMIVNDGFMILSSVFYTAFVASYLNVKEIYPRLYPFMITYIYVLLFAGTGYIVFLIIDPYHSFILQFFTYELLFVTIFSVGMLIYLIWKGVNGAGWAVIIGSLLLLVGNLTSMLGGFYGYLTPFVMVEVMIFALGLGYQIRLNDLERLKTKEELIEQLQLNEKLQKEMQSKLEIEVKIQTEKAIEMTQTAEVAKAERQKTELLNELEKVKVKALQSQMNPHFIFNCLNSIRLFYLNNDLEKGDDYITKFSRLIRSILNFSRMDDISLKEELDTLSLYMEFERMRFQNKFDFDIKINSQLDLSSVRIQSLLLQPFVENAIWHGLMPLESGGKVMITVESHKENSIIINIEDNGIGREKAKEFSKSSTQKHKSFGLQITKERLELLKHSSNKSASFVIIDLYDKAGEPKGTKVQIIYDL